jgi:pathogenesis-related protein 1
MARPRPLAAAALAVAALSGIVGASSGAPLPAPTVAGAPAPKVTLKRRVFVPRIAPVRPLTLPVLRPRGPAVLVTTADAGAKPAPTATTTATTAPADAGPPPPTKAEAVLTAAQKAAFVDKMNALRGSLGAASMQTIVWDENLAAFAATVAGQCQLAHSSTTDRMSIAGWVGTYVGENIAAGNGATLADASNPATISADLASGLDAWWSEKASYDYTANTCATGQVCGHYTQVAWAQTRAVGCAVVVCAPHATLGNAYSMVCEFGPGGNLVSQRPY